MQFRIIQTYTHSSSLLSIFWRIQARNMHHFTTNSELLHYSHRNGYGCRSKKSLHLSETRANFHGYGSMESWLYKASTQRQCFKKASLSISLLLPVPKLQVKIAKGCRQKSTILGELGWAKRGFNKDSFLVAASKNSRDQWTPNSVESQFSRSTRETEIVFWGLYLLHIITLQKNEIFDSWISWFVSFQFPFEIESVTL